MERLITSVCLILPETATASGRDRSSRRSDLSHRHLSSLEPPPSGVWPQRDTSHDRPSATALGSAGVERFSMNGVLDQTFGRRSLSVSGSTLLNVLVDARERILLTGRLAGSPLQTEMERLLPSGAPDPSFALQASSQSTLYFPPLPHYPADHGICRARSRHPICFSRRFWPDRCLVEHGLSNFSFYPTDRRGEQPLYRWHFDSILGRPHRG